jgi:hypothetical protein
VTIRVYLVVCDCEARFWRGSVNLAQIIRFNGDTCATCGRDRDWYGPGGRL